MTLAWLYVKEETFETLNLLRRKDEDDDSLIRRIMEYARCYMLIRGAESLEEKPGAELKRLEVVKDLNYFLEGAES